MQVTHEIEQGSFEIVLQALKKHDVFTDAVVDKVSEYLDEVRPLEWQNNMKNWGHLAFDIVWNGDGTVKRVFKKLLPKGDKLMGGACAYAFYLQSVFDLNTKEQDLSNPVVITPRFNLKVGELNEFAQDESNRSQKAFQRVFGNIRNDCLDHEQCKFSITAYGVLTEMKEHHKVLHVKNVGKVHNGVDKWRHGIQEKVFDFFASSFTRDMTALVVERYPNFLVVHSNTGLWYAVRKFAAWNSIGTMSGYGNAPYSQFTKVCDARGDCAMSPGFQ